MLRALNAMIGKSAFGVFNTKGRAFKNYTWFSIAKESTTPFDPFIERLSLFMLELAGLDEAPYFLPIFFRIILSFRITGLTRRDEDTTDSV